MTTAAPAASRASYIPPNMPLPWFVQLLPHQVRGVEAGLSADGFALFFDQRTGKTWVAGAIVHRRQPRNLLVVGIKTNLRSTWEKFFREKLPYYEIFWDFDSMRARQKEAGGKAYCVLFTNYEAVPGIIERAKKFFDDGMVVIDEAQKLKARGTRNSRMARKLRNVRYRLVLTGTPMDDSPIDLWAIMRFVDYTVLGINWGPFKEEWTVPSGYMGKVPKFKQTMLGRFIRAIGPYCMRITQEDAGIARAKVRWVRITPEVRQAELYASLERDMTVRVRGVRVTTPLTITQIGKLQQMTGGWVYDDDHNVLRVGRAKERHLRKWLLKRKGPVAIFCKFKPDVEICARVARQVFPRVAVLTGAVKDKPKDQARTRLLLDFQKGKFDVIVCQQETGGVGVDLYLAREAYVYSCSHSYVSFDQMVSRLTFIEQDEAAEFTVPYWPGTIDADIRVAIDEKRSVTQVVSERLRRRN